MFITLKLIALTRDLCLSSVSTRMVTLWTKFRLGGIDIVVNYIPTIFFKEHSLFQGIGFELFTIGMYFELFNLIVNLNQRIVCSLVKLFMIVRVPILSFLNPLWKVSTFGLQKFLLTLLRLRMPLN